MTDSASPSNPRDERSAALQIIERLRSADHIAYLAGGCVRDQLLGEMPKDYDVATSAHPEQIESIFRKTAAVGASFGVMLVRDFGPTIEVATFRSDGPYSDARRPDHVEFSTPELDAQRRDFTINALFLDPTPEGDQIIDFVNGQVDIEHKVLRAVGDPHHRLQEDHLRALRAVRFAARYDLTIDPSTRDAITQHASELSGVSIERIGHEIHRMMAHPSRARAARMIHELGLDLVIFGAGTRAESIPTLESLESGASAPVALSAWCLDQHGESVLDRTEALATKWSAKLDMSNADKDQFVATLEIAGVLISDWSSTSIAQRKRLAMRPHCCGAIMLVRAINPPLAEEICLQIEQLSSDGIGLAPEPLIDGQVLIEMGETPGAAFKAVLDRVYDAQLMGEISTYSEACNLAKELFVNYTKNDQ
ncbi:MAG: CCA tRNA nucleotidyltransferase [Phycisphaerales bacterium]|nr:CCA tRNA nucleotidyltransferase [Phycisphaerales bacterium]